ncbi:MAG: hypothetical protein VW338_19125 [Rhodospirillaceae bacterium]
MIDKKYQPVAFAFALIGALATGLSAGTAAAASAEDVKECKEWIKVKARGEPPADAVKLCEQGKFSEALHKAAVAALAAQDVKDCKKMISDLTGGKPPADAVKLCEQGKLVEAAEKAMPGGKAKAASGAASGRAAKHHVPEFK